MVNSSVIEISGEVKPGFEPISKLFYQQILRAGGGGALCVYWNNEPVVDIWGGVKDLTGASWEADTTGLSFSTTKGVLSTLLHWLLDREGLGYEVPICSIWPEFRANGKSKICIRDLMAHEAGLYDIRSLIPDSSKMLDWEFMVETLAQAEPKPVSSGRSAYHALTYGWLVGELIRRLTGKMPGDFFAETFVGMFSLDGAYIGVPKRKLTKVAQLLSNPAESALLEKKRPLAFAGFKRWVWQKGFSLLVDWDRTLGALKPRRIREFDFNSPEVLQSQIPAANGVFTARSLAKLYSMLAQNGEFEGKKIISESRMSQIRKPQSKGLDSVVPVPMAWRLGYHRILNYCKPIPRGLAHYGLGGSGAWADVDQNLSLGFIVNAGIGTPFGDYRIMQLTSALLKLVQRQKAISDN